MTSTRNIPIKTKIANRTTIAGKIREVTFYGLSTELNFAINYKSED